MCGPTTAIGHWCNREKSVATFGGERTVTGDKYVIDDEGWVTYSGRSHNMLKVGGIQRFRLRQQTGRDDANGRDHAGRPWWLSIVQPT